MGWSIFNSLLESIENSCRSSIYATFIKRFTIDWIFALANFYLLFINYYSIVFFFVCLLIFFKFFFLCQKMIAITKNDGCECHLTKNVLNVFVCLCNSRAERINHTHTLTHLTSLENPIDKSSRNESRSNKSLRLNNWNRFDHKRVSIVRVKVFWCFEKRARRWIEDTF